MKRFLLMGAVVFAACSQTGVTNAGSLAAPLDLVMVDRLPAGDALAQYAANAGLPSGLVFVTSTDSSELKVFETYRGGALVTTDWARGPDPLETLTIPVTDWADTLAVDEGRAVGGTRRTGPYVYAARRGGQELSVVSVRQRLTLARRASLPAPMSAMTAWMDVSDDHIPLTTTLYLATWDGETGRLSSASFTTVESDLFKELNEYAPKLTQVAAFPGEMIRALQVVPRRTDRTLDGAPFCATSSCMALATTSPSGAWRTVLVDLATNISASLDFGGPVRGLEISMRADGDRRLYGILDEEHCGGASCGGVLSVEIVAGTGGVFPRSTDLSNLPMEPMRVGSGLITGLTIGPGGALNRQIEAVTDSGVGYSRQVQLLTELGAFSSTNGYVSFFDPVAGLLLDDNALRADIREAVLRLPGQLADGGSALTDVDGGQLGTQELATLSWAPYGAGDHTLPWRTVTANAGGLDWQLEVFDGYMPTQLIYVVAHGALPGLTSLASTDADGTHLPVTTGSESSALVGDFVNFFTGTSTDGYVWCGRATVTALGTGAIDVDAVPAECVGRALFTVIAGPTRPLVVSGDLDGLLARGEPGTTMVYERRLAVASRNVNRVDLFDDAGTQIAFAPRAAMKITTPAAMPMEEGSAMTFSLNGNQWPYRISLDVSTAGGCYLSSTTPSQVELGPIAMGYSPWPQSSSSDPVLEWTTIGTVPSGNALVTMRHDYVYAGSIGSSNGVTCRQ